MIADDYYYAEYCCAEKAFATLELLLAEERPCDASLPWLEMDWLGPDERALGLFEAGVHYVRFHHDVSQSNLWQQRQERVRAWRRWLDEPANATELEAALVRTQRREVLADDLFELVEVRSRRLKEIEHMHTVVANTRERVARIQTRQTERREELKELDSVKAAAAYPPHSPQHYEPLALFVRLTDVACAQINSQTLRVLATHRRTAGLSLGEFRKAARVFTNVLPA